MDISSVVTKKIVAFGSKQIFLPKFTIALVRTPKLSPYHARFEVPLNFSKYDLRDYLYHAYNVKIFNIRSYVKMVPARDTTSRPGHLFREPNKKYMTVEMEKPFVWPAAPTNWEPWAKEEQKRDAELFLEENYAANHAFQKKQSDALRAQAQALLEGAKAAEEKKSPLELWQEQRTSTVLGKSP